MSLSEGDDAKAVVHCFAGCSVEEITAALGITVEMLRVRGSRGPGVDAAARDRLRTAMERARDLADAPGMMTVLRYGEGWTETAVTTFGTGLHSRARIAVPMKDHRGRNIGSNIIVPSSLRGLVPGPHKQMERGSKLGMIYPSDGLVLGSVVAVAEGAASALSAQACGVQSVGMPSASFVLTRQAAGMFQGHDVLLLPDHDGTGQAAAARWKKSVLDAGAASAGIVDLGHEREGEDGADLLRENGRERTAQRLRDAIGSADMTLGGVNRGGRPPMAIWAAESYLRTALGDHQWRRSRDIDDGRPNGISRRTMTTARQNLRIESTQMSREWWLRLPP